MTLREANKTLRSLDSRLSVRRTDWKEYRVSLGNREASAYYTDNLEDAIATGKAMGMPACTCGEGNAHGLAHCEGCARYGMEA